MRVVATQVLLNFHCDLRPYVLWVDAVCSRKTIGLQTTNAGGTWSLHCQLLNGFSGFLLLVNMSKWSGWICSEPFCPRPSFHTTLPTLPVASAHRGQPGRRQAQSPSAGCMRGSWNLSSLTRDWTGPWQWECQVLTTGPPGNSQMLIFVFFFFFSPLEFLIFEVYNPHCALWCQAAIVRFCYCMFFPPISVFSARL